MEFPLEDQTDEDFFDKLVDDDFRVEDSLSKADGMARAFLNLSIGDAVGSLDDSGEAGFATDAEVRSESIVSRPPEAFQDEVQPEDMAKMGQEVGPSASSAGHAGGHRVKTVQWSAFNSDANQLDSGGFGSYSDFMIEEPEASSDALNAAGDFKHGNSMTLADTFGGSFEQQADQFYNSSNGQAADLNDSQYWENQYPGWKYDARTEQWYQVDCFDSNGSLHSEGYTVGGVSVKGSSHAKVEMASNPHTKAEVAGNGFVSLEVSGVSYLQHTSTTVMESRTEEPATSSASNWNQDSPGIIEYPEYMVFDPQYPGWYYDRNTQQWNTLESYVQSIGKPALVQDHLSQSMITSDGLASNGSIDGGVYAQNYNSQGSVGATSGTSGNFADHGFWHSQAVDKNALDFSGKQQTESFYGSTSSVSYTDQIQGVKPNAFTSHYGYEDSKVSNGFHSFVHSDSNNTNQFNQAQSQGLQAHSSHSYYVDHNQTMPGMNLQNNLSQSYHGYKALPKVEDSLQSHLSQSYHGHENMLKMIPQNSLSHSYYGNHKANGYSQHTLQTENSFSQFSNGVSEQRSSAGRPPHPLVAFGFGGMLVVLKDSSSFSTTLANGSQDASKHAVSILHLSDVVRNQTDDSNNMGSGCSYFNALCQQSFPGPLVGGNVATRDVYKSIDETIKRCEHPLVDQRKGELLKLLLSLLKISCQHYGKLRSPFGADPSVEDADGPESAVTKLFASSRKNSSTQIGENDSFTYCMRNLPSEAQIQVTAMEVQNLLVSGRRKEALQLAQDGQLWGPALILAAQLGEKFYVDVVKQMACRQLICGSPLRTLCLLIAGQPADVFTADHANNGLNNSMNSYQQSTQVLSHAMLDEWEENLGIITSNRTKDDELVIIHLGDCLWKEREEVTAAHTCYLVAEANFESYSDSSRLCLIGADHWKCPRTYASPEAIQRTEVYEYSKVLGNPQFILLPFQPYKIIYAHMLTEVGRVSDSLRYCQASQKLLKNSGRTPEVETWKSLLFSLEERLKTHQQGGYGTNLDPAKLVGKLFTSIDRSIHRMMGAPPAAPLPPISPSNINDRDGNLVPKVASSQSSMAISSMIPSVSVEAMSEQVIDGGRNIMHNRSVSEPDFSRSPKQEPPKNYGSPDTQAKATASRFGFLGSSLRKTVDWVYRSDERQAKLGGENKFYYDEKLKTWVEAGAEPPAQQVLLPPPSTKTTAFQNGTSDYDINNAFKSHSHIPNGGSSEAKPPGRPEQGSSGTPPIPPSNNQFSARARMGVRSRYVDTFNKAGCDPSASSFQSIAATPMTPAVAPAAAKFFVPAAPSPSDEQPMGASTSNGHVAPAGGEPPSVAPQETSSAATPLQSPPHIQRFPSMDAIANHYDGNKVVGPAEGISNGPRPPRTRAASWGGSYGEAFGARAVVQGKQPSSAGSGAPSYFMPRDAPTTMQHNGGGGFGDELQEVEL